MQVADEIRTSGNTDFKAGDYKMAIEKYLFCASICSFRHCTCRFLDWISWIIFSIGIVRLSTVWRNVKGEKGRSLGRERLGRKMEPTEKAPSCARCPSICVCACTLDGTFEFSMSESVKVKESQERILLLREEALTRLSFPLPPAPSKKKSA